MFQTRSVFNILQGSRNRAGGEVLVAELLEDGEEVSLVPGRDEAVVEVTLEMRHAIPLLSALVALAAAIYAFINYTNI